MSTVIYGDTVGLMIWSEEPITISLESKELADSYQDFFASLLKISKKIIVFLCSSPNILH